MIQVREIWLKQQVDMFPSFTLFTIRLKTHLKSLEIMKTVGNRSGAVKKLVAEFAPGDDFVPRRSGIHPDSEGRLPAGHRVDTVLEDRSGQFLALELCLNNREAIGTNFMKLSAALDARSESSQGLAVLITLSRALLDFGGWDKSYGDTSEYIELFNLAYGQYMRNNVLILSLEPS